MKYFQHSTYRQLSIYTWLLPCLMVMLLCIIPSDAAWAINAEVLQQLKQAEIYAKKGDKEKEYAILHDLEKGNDPETLILLAEYYTNQPSKFVLTIPDYPKTVSLYQKVIDISLGSGEKTKWLNDAYYKLAGYYKRGRGVERNLKKAQELYHVAATAGHAQSAYFYAQMLERGLGSERDLKKALRWYRFALNNGFGNAGYAIASLYERALIVEPSENSANNMRTLGLVQLKNAANAENNVAAMLRLARIYAAGDGLEQDKNMALHWYQKASNAGSGTAMIEGATYILRLWPNNQKKKEEAVRWLRQAADKGEVKAALLLGSALAGSDLAALGVSENEALMWMEAAAQLGNAEAVNILADYYTKKQQHEDASVWLVELAQNGNLSSMIQLYRLHHLGLSKELTDAEANFWLDQANKKVQAGTTNENKASFARFLLDDVRLDSWQARGIKLMHEAAEAGHFPAILYLAAAYSKGSFGKPDIKQAKYWHEQAADKGNVASMIWLSNVYTQGEYVKHDQTKAKDYFERALANFEPGNYDVQTAIGLAYKRGIGVQKNMQEAVLWLERGMKGGNIKAKYEIARLALWGTISNYSPQDGLRMLTEAANAGSSTAQTRLAMLYATGRNVATDHHMAEYYFNLAASQGNAEAMRQLGLIHLGGFGLQKNEEKALYWLEMSASRGNSRSMLHLGHYYREKQAYTKAINWYEKASAQKIADADYVLGLMHLHGEGVAKNQAKAMAYIKKASLNRHHYAEQLYKQLIVQQMGANS